MNRTATLFFLALLLAATTAFCQLPYYIVDIDIQTPEEDFLIPRAYAGNNPFVAFDIWDNNSAWSVSNNDWAFTFAYSYDQSFSEGGVILIGSNSDSNRVYFLGATQQLFKADEYWCEIVGVHTSGYKKTFASGKLIEIYSATAYTNVAELSGQIQWLGLPNLVQSNQMGNATWDGTNGWRFPDSGTFTNTLTKPTNTWISGYVLASSDTGATTYATALSGGGGSGVTTNIIGGTNITVRNGATAEATIDFDATGIATGTPLYAYTETDPVWESEKGFYATGTPLYVETYTGDFKADGSVPMTGPLSISVPYYSANVLSNSGFGPAETDWILQAATGQAAVWASTDDDYYQITRNENVDTPVVVLYTNGTEIVAGYYKCTVKLIGGSDDSDVSTLDIPAVPQMDFVNQNGYTNIFYVAWTNGQNVSLTFGNAIDTNDAYIVKVNEFTAQPLSTQTQFSTSTALGDESGGDLIGDWELGGVDIATTDDVTAVNTAKVSKTGDTMTGPLIITPGGTNVLILTTSATHSNIAIGYGALGGCPGDGSVAIGHLADAVAGAQVGENVAIGYLAKGYRNGTAIGGNSTAYLNSVAVGNLANGYNSGSAVGNGANGYNSGSAVGNSANGAIYGSAVGNSANGAIYGSAVGNSANGAIYGSAVGYLANGAGTNIAIGVAANASGGRYRYAIGERITNTVDNSAAIRGTLYLDGGTGIFFRTTFGSGDWGPALIVKSMSGTNELVAVDPDGNETQLSAHDVIDGKMVSVAKSHNTFTGRGIMIDLEAMAREVEKLSGAKIVTTYTVPKRDWDVVEAQKEAMMIAARAAWSNQFAAFSAKPLVVVTNIVDGGEEIKEEGTPNPGPIPPTYKPRPKPDWLTAAESVGVEK